MATTASFPLSSFGPSSLSSSSSNNSTSSSPSYSASSSTSLSDTAFYSVGNAAAQRRIRFAPLPDPRRSVLITDDGDEVPIAVPDENSFSTSQLLPVMSSPAETCDPDPPCNDEGPAGSGSSSTTGSYVSSSSSSTPRTATPSEYSPMSSVGSFPVIRDTTLPPAAMAKSVSAPAAASSSSSSWPKPRSLNLLRPFKNSSNSSSGSSSHSLTPTSSADNYAAKDSASSSEPHRKGTAHLHAARKALSLSTEDILTLGTVNLFRSSSRDSVGSSSTATTTSGWALTRWASGTSASGTTNGSPLAKTQSTQSFKSKSLFSFGSGSSTSLLSSDAKSANPKSTTALKPKPAASKPFNRHKGTRMLNGRVYGGPKRSAALAANPFANARDEEQPEFVEWGYGGMGSVKGARSAGVSGAGGNVNWDRLHGGAAVREGVGVDRDAEELDDGSGMGWVKKRKEERERKEKERLAALEAEKENESKQTESKTSTPTPTRASTIDDIPIANSATATLVAEDITDEPGPILVSPVSPVLASAATIVPASYPSSGRADEVSSSLNDESTKGLQDNVKQDENTKDEEDHLTEKDTPTIENTEAQHPQEHTPDIVPVPARPAKHHHHNSISSHLGSVRRRKESRRTSSSSRLTPTPSSVDGDVTPNGMTKPTASSKGKVKARPNDINDAVLAFLENDASSESSASSTSSSVDSESEDEDEDEERARQESRRKTALGAGVEKVMRHMHKE